MKNHVFCVNEEITCTANTWRKYNFPNLPEHFLAIAVLMHGAGNLVGC